MPLIEVLIALALLQLWGANNPLHKDAWFARFSRWCADRSGAKFQSIGALGLAVLLPSLLVALLYIYLPNFVAVLFAAVVLVYCLGRGEFAASMEGYLKACGDQAWSEALDGARKQGVDCSQVSTEDWSKLHEQMLGNTAYQGFERLFAVLFWFMLLGPAGALIYRFSYMLNRQMNSGVSRDWLWILEWPAARLLGISLAVTGNFVGCLNRWKQCVICLYNSTEYVLVQSVMGALSVDDEQVQTCDVTQRELAALKRLYMRTLWFWVAVLALTTLLA